MKTVKQFCDELLATYGPGEIILAQRVSEMDGDVSYSTPTVEMLSLTPCTLNNPEPYSAHWGRQPLVRAVVIS